MVSRWLALFKKINIKIKTTVTKAEVIAKISEKTGIQKDDVTQTIEAFFKVVKDSMSEGENIYVRGFGSFVNKKRAKKIARNISKNTAIVIDEHYVPAFKPSKVFIEKIKNSKKVKELAPQE
ncbi:MAG TPA: HU family DNA-binding protein [Cyclobacteriaceae bacterium]|nr:HU family DNA-binding protein [Cyclobacteriaceae bacterium]